MKSFGVALGWCLLVASVVQGQAAVPARVRLNIPACATEPFNAAELARLARIELRANGVTEVEASNPPTQESPASADAHSQSLATITILASCEASTQEVEIQIDDALSHKQIRRVIDVSDVAVRSRPRALALAVAELLRASWAELALSERDEDRAELPTETRRAITQRLRDVVRRETRPSTTPSDSHAPRSHRKPVPWRENRFSFGVDLSTQAFVSFQSGLLGARLSASYAPISFVRLSVDAGASFGEAYDPIGDVKLRLISGALSASVVANAAKLSLTLGPRLEVGVAHGEGRALGVDVAEDEADELVVLISAANTLRMQLSGRVHLRLCAQLGYALKGLELQADDRRAAGIAGPWFGLTAGAEVELF